MHDNTHPDIIVCDIDGTLSTVAPSRAVLLEEEHPDWDRFYEDDFDDEPVEDVCRLVRDLSRHCRIVFCTSRRDSVREKTEAWLRRHLGTDTFVNGYDLLMRRGDDPRPDTAVKPELLKRHLHGNGIPASAVACVFEDSTSMARAWRQDGFSCLLVA